MKFKIESYSPVTWPHAVGYISHPGGGLAARLRTPRERSRRLKCVLAATVIATKDTKVKKVVNRICSRQIYLYMGDRGWGWGHRQYTVFNLYIYPMYCAWNMRWMRSLQTWLPLSWRSIVDYYIMNSNSLNTFLLVEEARAVTTHLSAWKSYSRSSTCGINIYLRI